MMDALAEPVNLTFLGKDFSTLQSFFKSVLHTFVIHPSI